MKRTSLAAAGAALFFGLVNSLPAFAQDATLRVGLTDPLDTSFGAAMVEFKRVMEEGTSGRVQVQLFPSAQLGSVPEMLENVQTGVQEMTTISPAYAGQFFPAFDVLEMPYLVTDWDQAQRLINSDAFARLMAEAEDTIGVKIVGTLPYGFRHIANSKHGVATLKDFAGLSLRAQNSPVHIAAFRALGANPVAIAWDETYQAVQTGVVDGLENANTVLISNRFPEIAKYISRTRHLFGMFLIVVGSDVYDRLSDEDKATFDKAINAAEAVNLKLAVETEAGADAVLTGQGAEVNDVSPEDVAAMQVAVQPVYQEFGPKFEPYLSDLRAAAAGN
jgi:tripartite ATP-independent transporter DctP family solute receptor